MRSEDVIVKIRDAGAPIGKSGTTNKHEFLILIFPCIPCVSWFKTIFMLGGDRGTPDHEGLSASATIVVTIWWGCRPKPSGPRFNH